MATKTIIQQRLTYWTEVYEKLQDAYVKLVEGGVKSYTIDDRQLTRFDIPDLLKQMETAEEKIDELSAALEGKRPRKAFGVIPRDW
jgi:hypothetical protein